MLGLWDITSVSTVIPVQLRNRRESAMRGIGYGRPVCRVGRRLFSTRIVPSCFLTFVRRVHSQTSGHEGGTNAPRVGGFSAFGSTARYRHVMQGRDNHSPERPPWKSRRVGRMHSRRMLAPAFTNALYPPSLSAFRTSRRLPGCTSAAPGVGLGNYPRAPQRPPAIWEVLRFRYAWPRSIRGMQKGWILVTG